MPKADSGASALASLLDGSTAGELIPELARHGLQQLIELEVAAVLGADRHERSEERSGYRNGSQGRLKVRHKAAGAAMLVPVLSGLLPSVGRPHCYC